MRCLIQYNILLKSKYGSLRVHKSTWQVGMVYSFLLLSKKLTHQDIYIRQSKRGLRLILHFNKIERMENQKMKDIKSIIANNVKLCQKKQNLIQFKLSEKAELSVDSIKRINMGAEQCRWKTS